MKYSFALCQGRHAMPVSGSIFPGVVDPLDLDALDAQIVSVIPQDCTELEVYVTGLTVALMAVVKYCHNNGIALTAMHFDRESGRYYVQEVLRKSKD